VACIRIRYDGGEESQGVVLGHGLMVGYSGRACRCRGTPDPCLSGMCLRQAEDG